MRSEENMKQELKQAVEKLCDDIVSVHNESYPSLTGFNCTYKAGRKFIKIIREDRGGSRSVWGFINLAHEKFKEGDVLLAQGWAGPALNVARGNLLEGYEIGYREQYGPGYCSGVIAGTQRNGTFI